MNLCKVRKISKQMDPFQWQLELTILMSKGWCWISYFQHEHQKVKWNISIDCLFNLSNLFEKKKPAKHNHHFITRKISTSVHYHIQTHFLISLIQTSLVAHTLSGHENLNCFMAALVMSRLETFVSSYGWTDSMWYVVDVLGQTMCLQTIYK